MYFKIAFITLIFYSLLADASESFQDTSWPNNLETHFPYPTPSPMRIVTSSARLVNTSSPLKISVPLHKKMEVTNNGATVILKLKEHSDQYTVTDGILGNDIYDFEKIVHCWNHDYIDPSGASIDGAGAPLSAVVMFYNRRYKTFEKATEQRDGLLVVIVRIAVEGVVPNKDFSKFESALRSVTTAGSNHETTVDAANSYYGLAPVPFYYAYPGSYYAIENGNQKQFDSATIIELSKSRYPSISIHQFSAFAHMKNSVGSPVNPRAPSYAPDSRPLVQAESVIIVPVQ